MAEYWFYDIQNRQLENYLPALLEKCLKANKKVVLHCKDDEVVRYYDSFLWEYDEVSFLAHGVKDSVFPEEHPIYITSDNDNCNKAHIRLYLHCIMSQSLEDFQRDDDGYERFIFLFRGAEKSLLSSMNAMSVSLKECGKTIRYLRVDPSGTWRSVD